MEKDNRKKVVNSFLVLVAGFVLILIIGFLTRKKPEYEYKISVEDALSCILHDSDKVIPEIAWKLINDESGQYRLIDLRNSYDYRLGHLDNAVNIPFKDILNPDYQGIFTEEGITNLFYAESEMKAIEACYLLKQMGYKNNKAVYGGYTFFTEYVFKKRKPAKPLYPDDLLKYEFVITKR